ncbi:MAG: two-component sensor histidine kinase [Segetibacter sp.]|nr:two-component sensor histidine kinase [Segetibacter sp.]
MKKIIILTFVFLCCSQLINAQNKNIDNIKQQLTSAKEDVNRVDILSNLSRFYMFFYPDTAENYGEQGLQLARKINYKAGEASCMLSLCITLTFSGKYISALDYGLQATPILTDLHDTTLLIWNNIQILSCYRQLEDYDQALNYGYNVMKLFKYFHADSNQLSVGLGAIGSVYEKKNQLDSALYFEQRAFASDTSWCQIFQYIGQTYAKRGHIDIALNYYKRGLNNAVKENNTVGFIDLCNNLSKVFELTGQIDSSILYANKAIPQSGLKINPEGLLETSTQLARLYEMQGKSDSTIKYLKAANTLKDSLYNRKKTREAQNFAFKEKLHQQDLIAQLQRDGNRIRVAVLLAVILIFLLIAFFLWRNNQQKQKAKNKIEKAYSDLKSTQAQLIQSEKMASLGELTAGIAHEIQNPLNFVNNFSDVNKELINEMKQEIKKGNYEEVNFIANDIEANEKKINHHGKRADAIVKGMLQHSRSSTGQKEPTDINALADEYLRLAYHGLRGKDNSVTVTMKTDFDESIGKINVISQEIGRVLLNLFNNAFYAVKEKSKQQNQNYEPTVTVSTKKMGDKILISVKDNGNGIPQNIVDKIFQPFFTTKPTGQGTGLGLSLSYDIVQAHSGQLKVEAKEDQGSKFIIQLPMSS